MTEKRYSCLHNIHGSNEGVADVILLCVYGVCVSERVMDQTPHLATFPSCPSNSNPILPLPHTFGDLPQGQTSRFATSSSHSPSPSLFQVVCRVLHTAKSVGGVARYVIQLLPYTRSLSLYPFCRMFPTQLGPIMNPVRATTLSSSLSLFPLFGLSLLRRLYLQVTFLFLPTLSPL